VPQYDPATGLEMDPATGLLIDPSTGYLLDLVNGRIIDPRTGYLVHPMTGLLIDPATGAQLDPVTLAIVIPAGFGSDTPEYVPGSGDSIRGGRRDREVVGRTVRQAVRTPGARDAVPSRAAVWACVGSPASCTYRWSLVTAERCT
jgi:hypothetical protein